MLTRGGGTVTMLRGSALLVAMMVVTAALSSARADVCQITTIGNDYTAADTLLLEFLSRDVGQTFVAPDTLLRSLTIWRTAQADSTSLSLHLFIVDVDSAGRVIPNSVIFDGPTLQTPLGDGVHPVPYTWAFDPPISLPRRGTYCFVAPSILCGFSVQLLGSKTNPYPDGGTCRVFTDSFSGCVLPSGAAGLVSSTIDIVFKAEFCNTSTPVRGTRWGEMKLRYR